MPSREHGIETNGRINASYLNGMSLAGQKKVIITVRLLRILFLSLMQMEQDKEAITEKETETRSEDVNNLYCVHHL